MAETLITHQKLVKKKNPLVLEEGLIAFAPPFYQTQQLVQIGRKKNRDANIV
jgi:hypothetical protein